MSAIEIGLCQCGCGEKTPIALKNDRSKNHVKNKPLAYLKGHNFRLGKAGKESPRWAGGKTISTHGYVVICTPEGRKYEHIMVAEKALGRPLPKFGKADPRNLVVHHIDGDKQNNVAGNLLICTHAYHTALHHRLEQSAAWPEFAKIVRNVGPKND